MVAACADVGMDDDRVGRLFRRLGAGPSARPWRRSLGIGAGALIGDLDDAEALQRKKPSRATATLVTWRHAGMRLADERSLGLLEIMSRSRRP